MLWTNTKRIIKSGFVSFWRNSFVSLAAVLVLTVTLFVIGSLLFIGATLDAALTQIKNKVDVNVYFLTTAPEEDIVYLQSALEALPEVASVDYVSREEALANFRERHQDDQLTLQALDELEENPLGANLSIRAKETSQYESIANFLEDANSFSGDGSAIIDKVNYFQNKVAIDKLTKVIDSSEKFGLIVIAILVIASIIISFNTIRLAIYVARDEIKVMRLVGASNTYIRGPFVFEGIMYGIISAIITLILFYPLTLWLGPITEGFFSNINIFEYYTNNFGNIFVIVLVSGILLGGLSSYLAVKKYLKT